MNDADSMSALPDDFVRYFCLMHLVLYNKNILFIDDLETDIKWREYEGCYLLEYNSMYGNSQHGYMPMSTAEFLNEQNTYGQEKFTKESLIEYIETKKECELTYYLDVDNDVLHMHEGYYIIMKELD